MSDAYDSKELLRLKNIVVGHFTQEHWLELGMITESLDFVEGHGRLLRSLAFGDEDYGGNAIGVLMKIASKGPEAFKAMKDYIDERFPDDENFISSKPRQKRVTFSPNVFEIPDAPQDEKLISVMMPFGPEFRPVYEAIKAACEQVGFDCKRADDIWEESILIQDIFRLIFTSRIVISDFTGRNPNVMYETGIAHTLGKTVVPITQHGPDIPFDLIHHRYLKYLGNTEGVAKLKTDLIERLIVLKG